MPKIKRFSLLLGASCGVSHKTMMNRLIKAGYYLEFCETGGMCYSASKKGKPTRGVSLAYLIVNRLLLNKVYI